MDRELTDGGSRVCDPASAHRCIGVWSGYSLRLLTAAVALTVLFTLAGSLYAML